MWRCGSVPVLVLALVPIFVLSGHPSKNQRLKPSFIFPRAIKNYGDHKTFFPSQGGQREDGVGNPAEWTMSKANLVAEFYSTENAPPPGMLPPQRDRSQKSFFSFFTNNNSKNNNSRSGVAPPTQRNSRLTPYPPPKNGNINLIASETNYNAQALAFENSRHGQSGFSTPFRPIIKFPQQNYIVPSNLHESGYPNNLRPPRGPPPPPHASWDANSAQINGLRPPFNGPTPQQPPTSPNPPGKLYLPPTQYQSPQPQMQPPQQSGYIPPQNQPSSSPPQSGYIPPQQPTQSPQSGYIPPQQQGQNPQSGYLPPSQQMQPPQSAYIPPQPSIPPPSTAPVPQQPQTPGLYQPPPPKPAPIPQKFVPSQEYLPPQSPSSAPPGNEPPKFQPVSPPPQIIDAYRNQAVYPVPPQAEKPLVLIMANSSFEPSQKPKHSQYLPPGDSFTQYENEHDVKAPSPAPSKSETPTNQSQKPGTSPSTELALTEPLSHVLAEANAKAGDAMDKTIRFVIHKPEDENVVKNAILEDAQTRYEDVRFVQGPTLKVQRKETVYLPPKKKTVVYILLKEPQIDTDVEVMTQDEEDPVPEVYITYQKSDGAVKTKHYSPKPIKEEDMKKYLDIDDTSYGSGEESNVQPRFSKTTSVSLSTSSRTSRTSATMSASQNQSQKPEDAEKKEDGQSENQNSLLLKNHRLSPFSYPNNTNTNTTLPVMKASPLLYSQTSMRDLIGNSTKKARSSAILLPSPVYPPRRISRNLVQCRPNV